MRKKSKVALLTLFFIIFELVMPMQYVQAVQKDLVHDASVIENTYEEMEVKNNSEVDAVKDNNSKVSLTKIMDKGVIKRQQMISYLMRNNTNKSFQYASDFVRDIIEEASIEGVSHDVLFSQIMHETGFLKFGGDVSESQNNFAGIGAVGGGAAGASFPSIKIGIRAVVQHLKAYASKEPLKQAVVDPRFHLVTRGSAIYVEHLGQKENPTGHGWATDKNYGYKIINIMNAVKKEPIKHSSEIDNFTITGEKVFGSEIKLTAKATPGNESLYRYLMLEPNGRWSTIKEYSTNSTISYKLNSVGNYRFVVHVKNRLSDNDYDDLKYVDIKVTTKNSSITSFTKSGAELVGTNMTMTAIGTPSSETLYRFLVRDAAGSWSTIQEYSSKNVANYKPEKAGWYRYVVHVKNKASNKDYDELKVIDFKANTKVSKIIDFKRSGEEVIGSQMTMTATGTPSNETLYRFLVKDPTGYWRTIQEYSTKNAASYVPQKVGVYRYVVHVKNKASVNDYDELKVMDFSIGIKTSKVVSFKKSGEEVIGSQMTMTATGTPSNETLYRFLVKDPTGYWRTIQEYSTKNAASYVPQKVGVYRYVVHVKNKASVNDYDELKVIDFKVGTKGLNITSFETTGSKTTGTNMTMQAKASISKDTLYRFLVKDSVGSWRTIQEYSTKNSANYIPKKAGSYRYVVHVKNKYSQNDYDELKYIDLYVGYVDSVISSFNVNGEKKTGVKLELKAEAKPEMQTMYRFLIKDHKGRWSTIREYEQSKSISFMPRNPGKYRFVVHVKNVDSDKDYDDLKYIDVDISGPSLNKMIVVDPGHNYGGDDGAYATHNGVRYSERDINMQISLKLKQELERYDFNVVLTRNPGEQEYISVSESLKKRVNLANMLKADFFISVHQNSFSNPSANGMEVYYSDKDPIAQGRIISTGEVIGEEVDKRILRSDNYKVRKSKEMGLEIVNSVTSELGITNRGLKNSSFYVAKNTLMPSLLVECGFISNYDEVRRLTNPQFQGNMARIIASKINENL